MNDVAVPASSPARTVSGIDALHHALRDYAQRWPSEAAVVDLFGGLLDEAGEADPFTRDRLGGHFTASSWLVDRSGSRVLLTHHRKLDRWLQLGGHADGDRDLARVALREAEEESGLTGLSVEAAIFDLDRHWIPKRGDVPGHWHYDVRFVVRSNGNEDYVVSEESHDLAWREIAAIAGGSGADASMQRMAGKWLLRG
ncbi:NUDIX hydrolase [Lysobacter niabensis]|uniref:NUDIX hydrolase n=1 Tax=Agrilutibacter niabensis TaxID=380628 RepID=UPI0036150C02